LSLVYALSVLDEVVFLLEMRRPQQARPSPDTFEELQKTQYSSSVHYERKQQGSQLDFPFCRGSSTGSGLALAGGCRHSADRHSCERRPAYEEALCK